MNLATRAPESEAASTSTAKPSRRRWVLTGAAAIVLLIVATVAFVQTRAAGAHPQTVAIKFKGHGDLPAPTWTITTGHWQQSGGTAFASAIGPGWTLAAANRGVADGTISTTLDPRGAEAGIAFRVRDIANFWAFTASPRFGTWNVSKIVGGNVVFVANSGLTQTRGRHQVAVRLSGTFIDVSIDGHGVSSIDDADLETATGAGMVMLRATRAKTARWDGLTATFSRGGPKFAESPGS